MGFFAGIALMVIAAGTAVSTAVLVIVGLAQGDWKAYLLPVKWILGCAWVLSIGTVVARVQVFGWQLRRAQRQAAAQAPPADPADGQAPGRPADDPAARADQSSSSQGGNLS
jgi:hypothetical protein